MRISTRVRRTLATLAAIALVTTGTLSTASAANAARPSPPPSGPPTSAGQVARMAALGDSITQAIMTCSSLSSCAPNSWSTGSTASVNSHYLRLKAAGAKKLVAYNNAVSGALSGTLNAQAQRAASQQAQYVTIEIGANDACTPTVETMTPAPVFKENVQAALTTLAATPGGPPRVFVAGVPNLHRLWEVYSLNSSARLTWGLLKICQSLLANPSSTAQVDLDRRGLVKARVAEYNTALAELCAVPANNCRYDGGAVAATEFAAGDISTRDYFHPSLAGQAKLAAVTWPTIQWAS
jgi:lysophospholipase L1-like esterase